MYSTRRVTRSQQQPAPVTPKKYPLRQTRSSGSETEQVVDFSDRGTGGAGGVERLQNALGKRVRLRSLRAAYNIQRV